MRPIRTDCGECRFMQMEAEAKQAELNAELDEVFDRWDNEATGHLDVKFVECELSLYKPVPLADAVAQGMNWRSWNVPTFFSIDNLYLLFTINILLAYCRLRTLSRGCQSITNRELIAFRVFAGGNHQHQWLCQFVS